MSVTIDLKGLKNGLAKIDALVVGTPKTTAKAINKALPKIKKAIVDRVNEDYLITKANINKTIKVDKAGTTLSAFIRSKGGPIALTKFRVTPKRPPKRKGRTVVAQVMRSGGGGGAIPNAFIARMRSGHIGAMYRKGADRYPIGQFHGPSVPSMLGTAKISAFIGDKAEQELQKQMELALDALIGG